VHQNDIENGGLDSILSGMYADLSAARVRCINAVEAFSRLYGAKDIHIISAPGRTEIGGNHTDHQHGRALAAAIDLDVLCVCSINRGNVIRVSSEGFTADCVQLTDLSVQDAEKGRNAAILRGVASWFSSHGYEIGGFDAYVTSAIPVGVGLSSSAAFEVAVGNMLKALYGSKITPLEIAKAGQFAENVYYGKPCGLLDQMASSLGGIIMMDFSDPENPQFEHISSEPAGYNLCVVNAKGSHAELTQDYADIPQEMRLIAQDFNREYLRDTSESAFYDRLAELRKHGDRSVLRAMHFFGDNERVLKQCAALQEGRTDEFLLLVNESGRSSELLLQNIYSTRNPQDQGLTLALAVSRRILGSSGAVRVHGGGFAGTIQAYVPEALRNAYTSGMEAVFGEGCCNYLRIRSAGGTEVS